MGLLRPPRPRRGSAPPDVPWAQGNSRSSVGQNRLPPPKVREDRKEETHRVLGSCPSSLGPRVLAPETCCCEPWPVLHVPPSLSLPAVCSHWTSEGFGLVLLSLFQGCQGPDLCPAPEVQVAAAAVGIICAEALGTLQSGSAQGSGSHVRAGDASLGRALPSQAHTWRKAGLSYHKLGEMLKQQRV